MGDLVGEVEFVGAFVGAVELVGAFVGAFVGVEEVGTFVGVEDVGERVGAVVVADVCKMKQIIIRNNAKKFILKL